MKTMVINTEAIMAHLPRSIVSAPSVGPISKLLIGSLLRVASKVPARNTPTRSSTSCLREAARDAARVGDRALNRRSREQLTVEDDAQVPHQSAIRLGQVVARQAVRTTELPGC